jgi:hypothetical protein
MPEQTWCQSRQAESSVNFTAIQSAYEAQRTEPGHGANIHMHHLAALPVNYC